MSQQKTNNLLSVLQNQNKYAQGRSALLCVVILSVVNLFSVTLTETYFLFSSYVTQLLAVWGAVLYMETQAVVFPVIFGVIGLISVVPYLLCYLFSKKRAGWMIGALVLFGIDSLIFLVDFISLVMVGDVSLLIDLVIRVWVIASLSMGVKYGLRVDNDRENAEAESVPTAADYNPDAEEDLDEMASVTRSITIARPKSFVGCALQYSCCVDGKIVATLKNGETQTVQISGKACELVIVASAGVASNAMEIPEGYDHKSYTIKCKMGFSTAKLILEEGALEK